MWQEAVGRLDVPDAISPPKIDIFFGLIFATLVSVRRMALFPPKWDLANWCVLKESGAILYQRVPAGMFPLTGPVRDLSITARLCSFPC